MTKSATTPEEAMRHSWRQALSNDEVHTLLAMRDVRSWFTLALNWGIIAASFAMVAVWPNVFSVILALFLIGGRMLGFAVLMHDASHRALFKNRKMNDWAGNWLAAYPIWSDWQPYRPYHLQHHGKTGTADDPDIGLVKPFPITRKSLARKMWRDLSGQTGRKFAKGAFKRTFSRAGEDEDARRGAIGVTVTNVVLLGILTVAGHPALYLLWVVAWLTTYTWVTRIRAIAEHALTPDQNEPLRNTRTTLASPLERLFIAPNRVNYHLEHHLLMTVPHYNLPRMHELLKERGILDDACIEYGYKTVLERAASKRLDANPGADDPADYDPSRLNGLISPPDGADSPRDQAL